MELFTRLFGDLLAFIYHGFDRIVINGYLSGLARPEQVVYFFREVLGIAIVSKEVLSQRVHDYQGWVEPYARNHQIPIEWAEKGVRKEDYVLLALRRLVKKNAYRVYFVFKSMEQGRTFRINVPQIPYAASQLLLELEKAGILVAQYFAELPPREVLERRLHEAIVSARAQLEAAVKD